MRAVEGVCELLAKEEKSVGQALAATPSTVWQAGACLTWENFPASLALNTHRLSQITGGAVTVSNFSRLEAG